MKIIKNMFHHNDMFMLMCYCVNIYIKDLYPHFTVYNKFLYEILQVYAFFGSTHHSKQLLYIDNFHLVHVTILHSSLYTVILVLRNPVMVPTNNDTSHTENSRVVFYVKNNMLIQHTT